MQIQCFTDSYLSKALFGLFDYFCVIWTIYSDVCHFYITSNSTALGTVHTFVISQWNRHSVVTGEEHMRAHKWTRIIFCLPFTWSSHWPRSTRTRRHLTIDWYPEYVSDSHDTLSYFANIQTEKSNTPRQLVVEVMMVMCSWSIGIGIVTGPPTRSVGGPD